MQSAALSVLPMIMVFHHCDNEQFSEKLFLSSCEANGQRVTFYGVNVHFQNGIAEKAIHDITETAHKMLLHAKL